ncbi:alpha-1,3-mannosyl-glycoprotein 4-beta-N-acetylglucosaminyltransferase A-like [Mercenaria mercenaria]|uniref:alpha-1,3-mannosyl-glycoprotein 4-beta-N-acetylglucosaminyltransferase A-like n=1 Tax=Mercenaria mercenaria TaxID=6596 RepID=UPI00234F0065|nr:alpha-1,3-mannosyl-glycoprotein 4-beta-N-acetylglucosaminyltransferase A-like [Mercenaria mercenaria]
MASQRNLKVTVVVLVTYSLLQLQLMQSKDKMSASSIQHLRNHELLTAASSVNKDTKEQHLDSTTMSVPVQRSQCGSNVTLLLGHQRQNRGFLTIGLCTVPRSKASYLKDTLHSLVTRMSEADKKRVVIVVFMGYHNESITEETLRMIKSNFNHTLETGGLQVVQPDISIYPNLSKITRRTFNDTLQRVHWRTKQNIDFAYLFGYCEGISDYYLHVEDDVVAATGYISDIETSLSNQKRLHNQWFVLEFAGGFFGKLFRSSDLCMMKTYLLLFQVEKPGDWLLADLKNIKLHDSKKVKHGKRLFKHLGRYSSLEGKIVKIENKTAIKVITGRF